MPLRLFSKQEVEQKKAAERAKTVAEGVGLANRVDVLRETKENEEASLTEFRIKTVSGIQAEVDGLTTRRDLLTDEVLGLEQRKTEALVPLDAAWEEVRLAQADLKSGQDKLAQDQDALESGKTALATERAVYEADAKLLKEGRDEVDVLIAKAQAIDDEARSNRADAQRTLTDAQEYRKMSERELGDRERGITATAERQQKRDQEQDERELDLNRRETLLADREGLLERDTKRFTA
jgi:hypothetical protein